MTLEAPKPRSQRTLLRGFIYGSLAVLLVCLFGAALILSETYLKKERARASDSAELISHFFASHYRGIREEMWTQSYDAIHLRVSQIAKELGEAKYDLTILNDKQECVFRRGGPESSEPLPCEVPPILKALIPSFQVGTQQHIIQFDYKTERYLYMIPIYAGSMLKGFLFASLSDPYDFHQESSFRFVTRIFGFPILCIVLIWLLWLVISQRLILRPYLEQMVDLEKKQAVAELAGKVAHNIQSPLVVVKSVARNIRGIDESQRRLLISASSRIEKIANHLISHFTSQKVNLDSTSFCFLWPVIDSSVGEKIAILGASSEIDLKYHIDDGLYCAGVPLPAEELGAVLSNLMNNSIDAMASDGNSERNICVTARSIGGDTITIEVSDTGRGIPPEIFAKLERVGGTYGKANGAGIGLKHAREILAKAGGRISIQSKVGQGTRVVLEVPRATLPSWCSRRVDLSKVQSVVVLDDDPSVHLLWQQRLGSFPTTYLTDPDHLDLRRFPDESTFFILDYEIVGKTKTGLDLIVQNQLGSNAILVTSYFNEVEIQNGIERAGAMMLPKFMINRISIEFGDIDRNSKSAKYDLILIDDDPMIHELWQFSAAQMGYRLKAAFTMSELDLDQFERDIPIFVDKNLGEGLSGIEVARSLNQIGFVTLFLTTGEKVSKVEVPEFIIEVRNKDFPSLSLGTSFETSVCSN